MATKKRAALKPGALLYNRTCWDTEEWGIEVYNWTSHELCFEQHDPNHYARMTRPDGTPNLTMGCLHWTGGEGDYRAVYRTLRKRELGIHFFIDHKGRIFQFADPAVTVCPHAGAVNRYAYGIEMQGRGTNHSDALNKRRPRGVERQELHGEERSVALFTTDQVEAALGLCDAMADLANIPRRIPDHLDAIEPADARKKFRGVLGHLHVSSRKLDPGAQLFEALEEEGWKPVAT
jgi:N-acetyl-anhydromuramyl-L-alanine amidase AmpD